VVLYTGLRVWALCILTVRASTQRPGRRLLQHGHKNPQHLLDASV